MAFDISLIHRVADEIGECAERMKQHINSPNELQKEMYKLQGSINSMQTLINETTPGGANVNTTQLAPKQNQS